MKRVLEADLDYDEVLARAAVQEVRTENAMKRASKACGKDEFDRAVLSAVDEMYEECKALRLAVHSVLGRTDATVAL